MTLAVSIASQLARCSYLELHGCVLDMGCKQSIPFKETRKVATKRPSPLSISSSSETTEKHPSRQVAAAQSEIDEKGQTLHSLGMGSSTTADGGESTDSHANRVNVTQILSSGTTEKGIFPVSSYPQSQPKASTDIEPSYSGSGKPCWRNANVNSRVKEFSCERPSHETGASSCKFPNCLSLGPGAEAAVCIRETRHKPACSGSVQSDCTIQKCCSENPGQLHVSGARTESAWLISRTNSVDDTLQVLPRHRKKCPNSSSDEDDRSNYRECDPPTGMNYSFIARPTPYSQPWELDDGRWTQAGALPREKLIEVHRTPLPQQTNNMGGVSRRFCFPGYTGEGFPPSNASSLYVGIPGRQKPEGQFFALTEQSHRACRAVALVSKAEKQRRASYGPTNSSYHPTGYVATDEAVASRFRELRAQKQTVAVPSTEFSESLPFSRNQPREDRGAQRRYAAKLNGDASELRGEPTRGHHVSCEFRAAADDRCSLRPGPETGLQWSSTSRTEAVQRRLAARRAAKRAFIAPPSTNMGPILQPCC